MAHQPPPPPWAISEPHGSPVPAFRTDYASWPYRVASYLIDFALGSAPAWISIFVVLQLASADPTGSGPAIRLVGLLGRLAALGLSGWNLRILQGRTGHSVGKLIVGTKLVSEGTGQPIGALAAFLRSVAHLLDILPCFVGYLWPIWDSRRQTFADKLAGTIVVRA